MQNWKCVIYINMPVRRKKRKKKKNYNDEQPTLGSLWVRVGTVPDADNASMRKTSTVL